MNGFHDGAAHGATDKDTSTAMTIADDAATTAVKNTSGRRAAFAPTLAVVLVAAGLSLAGCAPGTGMDPDPEAPRIETPAGGPTTPDRPTDSPEVVAHPDGAPPAERAPGIRPVASVYRTDGYGTVDVVRLDVRTVTSPGDCEPGDYSGCTLADIQADVDRRDELKPRIDVHLVADDYPEDGLVVNAEMRQRGGTTRKAAQKSFRIRLDDRDAPWRSERSLYLNKHPYESDRIRNKLAFDLMSEIPNLMSSRTQFANLWIDDGAGPVDYGLFTHVEAPGANWLRKRGLDDDDRLYKVNYFRFGLSDLANVQVDEDGEPLDEERFETSLEIEAGDDHRTLVKMLTDFHDPALRASSPERAAIRRATGRWLATACERVASSGTA